jgi:hypothetical protein
MRFYLLPFLICCSLNLFAVQPPQTAIDAVDTLVYPCMKVPEVYTNEDLLKIIQVFKADTQNLYHWQFAASDTTFTLWNNPETVLLFNEKEFLYDVVPRNTCGNPINTIFSANDLSTIPIRKEVTVNNILANCTAMSSISRDGHKPTAIIFWNRTSGIFSAQNAFVWERLLLKRFPMGINIIKVNTDVHASWNKQVKASGLQFYKTFCEEYCDKLLPSNIKSFGGVKIQ